MELPGVAIRHPLHRSFQRSRYCGSAWFMISGSIDGTKNSLKRKYPAREQCWISFSTGSDHTDYSETYPAGLSSTGEKTSASECLPNMQTSDLLSSTSRTSKRFTMAQTW